MTNRFIGFVIFSIGLGFFILTAFLLFQQSTLPAIEFGEKDEPEIIKVKIRNGEIKNAGLTNAAIICVICGVLVEIVALTVFYFYARNLNQLDVNQRFLLANCMCEDLKGKYEQEARTKVIESLIWYESEDQEKSNNPIGSSGGNASSVNSSST